MTTAPSMTYTSLIDDIKLYAERTDKEFVAQIPRFIMMAENTIASKVRGLGMQKVVSGVLEIGVEAFPKPVRWRENISFNYTSTTGRKSIFKRSYEFCRKVSPDANFQAWPRYYADYTAEHFLIVPAPQSRVQFELFYYERPEPLSDANQTNWTTRYAPQLLLYATLLQAQPFLKNDARVATFKLMYDEAVANIQEEARRRVIDRSAEISEE